MTTPKLYIIMRRDLWDMNPGKGMAQAAHAQADFDAYVPTRLNTEAFRNAYMKWTDDRNFGVTLALSATLEQMHEIRTRTAHSDFTIDPSYPYRNWYGELFVREEVTCMWVFVYEENESEYMKAFALHE